MKNITKIQCENYFKYYDVNIHDDLELIEKDLNDIKRKKEEKEKESEQRRNYEISNRYNENDEDDYYERKRSQKIYNNNNSENQKKSNNVLNIPSSSPRLCKDCSQYYCIFCKKKKTCGSILANVHNECFRKNYLYNCFICKKSLHKNWYTHSHYCRDCSKLYGENNIRKTCPKCKYGIKK